MKEDDKVLQEKLIEILQADEHVLRDLSYVRRLELPHWCISAGYVRNLVWDRLHGYAARTPLNDVDVLYYDPDNLSEEAEKAYEAQLHNQLPGYSWSFKNQARMHLRNHHKPYTSIEEAMMRWPETATAVAVHMDSENQLHITAPYGLEDLFGLVVRRSPHYADKEAFHARVENKKWLEYWPGLRLMKD